MRCYTINESETAIARKLSLSEIQVRKDLESISGAGFLAHGEKNKSEVDKYGKEALDKAISDAVSILK